MGIEASHPVVPANPRGLALQGPLWEFDRVRPRILDDVIATTRAEFENAPLDLVLGEALYAERTRLKRFRTNLFTKARKKADSALWSEVQSGLLTPAGLRDRKALLDQVIRNYAEEIGGHFDPKIYRFSTQAVPFLFDWLLNAASIRKFTPWKMKEHIQTRLKILGEVESLRRLAERGTVLLVPTHQSNIDSILIGYVIHQMGLPPFAYGAGLNLFSNPLLSFFMSNLGAYTVDRTKQNDIYKLTLKNYSTRILREGVHSIFFPGGGRCRSGAIEDKLKLGLLGTALDAQILNYREDRPRPSIFVVPMVTSYHFVLEASSLIDDYLAGTGKGQFISTEEDVLKPVKILNFFWTLFAAESDITVRVGRPMDIFGNFVDDEGRSLGPNGTTVDPRRWLTTRGELRADPDRDREYVRGLGARIGEGFHRHNTVLSSHLLAYAFFEALRKQHPDLSLYRFLRLSLAQRSLPFDNFLNEAEKVHARVKELADKGRLFFSEALKTSDTRAWVKDGLANLGLFHGSAVVRADENSIWSEDMNLLYYYRNRLTGYGIRYQGNTHGKGFLE